MDRINFLTRKQRKQMMAKCKPVTVELPCGEKWIMQIPVKTYKGHFEFIYGLLSNPKFNGDVLEGLVHAFPDLSRWEAVKINALFTLFVGLK